jgi:hypothetical protein
VGLGIGSNFRGADGSRLLNFGNSEANAKSETYEALSGALSSA